MKTKVIFKITAIFLIMTGSISSCSKSEIGVEDIIGKWELIGVGNWYHNFEIEAKDPKGCYVEFLPDGIFRSYNSENDDFFFRSYKIDRNFIYFDFEKTYEQGRFDYKCNITKDQIEMKHYQGNTDELHSGHIFIYQRIK